MSMWKRWERNGSADVVRAAVVAVVTITVLLLGIWAAGGLDLLDTLKGY